MSFKSNFPTFIGNCRSYPAPATSMTNVYTVLINIKKMLNKIGISLYILSCDEAVYQICKEVQLKTKNEFDNMLFHLEGFHIAKIFLGIIGKRMEGSGFSEILEDTSLYGPTRLKVMCNLSFSRELSFFSGHHCHIVFQ